MNRSMYPHGGVDDCVIFVVVCSDNASWYVDVEILRELEIQIMAWSAQNPNSHFRWDGGSRFVIV
jgi:hypothetical protein